MEQVKIITEHTGSEAREKMINEWLKQQGDKIEITRVLCDRTSQVVMIFYKKK